MTTFDLTRYLARIGLSDADLPVTPDSLRAIQTAQLRSIPFEDIDPFLGRTPDLSPAAIFDKTVHSGRGGYCFELNSLLHDALKALGFDVRRSMARVRRASPLGGPRSHLLLQVDIGAERWLADTGFGGPGPLIPLRIGDDRPQQAPNGSYRLRGDPATGEKVLERRSADGWVALYGFDDAWVGDMDIAGANYLCANWSEMPFPNHLMLAGFDGDIRIGVFDRALRTYSAQGDSHRDLSGAQDLATLLRRLGLTLAPGTPDRLWAKLSAA